MGFYTVRENIQLPLYFKQGVLGKRIIITEGPWHKKKTKTKKP